MTVSKKHYVVFESPGTMFSESSSKEIPEWSTALAMRLSTDVVERHGAKPFAFRFKTQLEADPIDDGQGGQLEVTPKTVKESGRYFIKGVLRTIDDVRKKKDPTERIMFSNMECNGYPIVCETRNSYLTTHPFEVDDCVVDGSGNVVERGNDPKHIHYRTTAMERIRKERGW